MAYLYYGSENHPAEIPDRLLAHVKVVAATKLRRNESFLLSWRHPGDSKGRTSVWMQPSIPLRFVFDDAEPDTLDAEFLRTLANEATTSRGIILEWDEQPVELEISTAQAVAA
jgi:hypothetical protein